MQEHTQKRTQSLFVCLETQEPSSPLYTRLPSTTTLRILRRKHPTQFFPPPEQQSDWQAARQPPAHPLRIPHQVTKKPWCAYTTERTKNVTLPTHLAEQRREARGSGNGRCGEMNRSKLLQGAVPETLSQVEYSKSSHKEMHQCASPQRGIRRITTKEDSEGHIKASL